MSSSLTGHCYCGALEAERFMLNCQKCRRLFHLGCLTSGRPSNLVGDTYFNFTCSLCSPTGTEVVERSKLLWIHVIVLAMYNIQLQGGSKCGFYRWREICKYIDRNWDTFFRNKRLRKKTSTWHGTIAGTLSANCPQLFRSGTSTLGESGWWALNSSSLPTPMEIDMILANQKVGRKSKSSTSEAAPKAEGSRHRLTKTVTQVEEELEEEKYSQKIKQSVLDKEITASPSFSIKVELEEKSGVDYTSVISENSLNTELSNRQEENMPDLSANIQNQNICEEGTVVTQQHLFKDDDIPLIKEEIVEENDINDLSYLLHTEEDVSFDIDLDPNSITPPSLSPRPELPAVEDLLSIFSCVDEKQIDVDKVDIKQEPKSDDDKQMEGKDNSKTNDSDEEYIEIAANNQPVSTPVSEVGRKRKAVIKEPTSEEMESKPKCQLISIYEEQQLLKKLETMPHAVSKHPVARRLRRKLIIRKLKREKNIPVFNMDTTIRLLCGISQPESTERTDSECRPVVPLIGKRNCILDRYQIGHYIVSGTSHNHPNFITRLMGLEEDCECIISPHTERILKPYIFRDYETVPLKLKLLNEIVAHYHRKDLNWKPSFRYPIDYCYVRPQHIPVVNSLCREYFWPGIDLSECLQYPDFSCIALYRKVVIGFAFMVPDVKYRPNEAYISFIFTHPEWRNAGISTFMLYHLIQTCMGKDVTLHVSATNPALFLYQKFGFKVEEFILDFYDKYFPADSKECRHAMFLRLCR